MFMYQYKSMSTMCFFLFIIFFKSICIYVNKTISLMSTNAFSICYLRVNICISMSIYISMSAMADVYLSTFVYAYYV